MDQSYEDTADRGAVTCSPTAAGAAPTPRRMHTPRAASWAPEDRLALDRACRAWEALSSAGRAKWQDVFDFCSHAMRSALMPIHRSPGDIRTYVAEQVKMAPEYAADDDSTTRRPPAWTAVDLTIVCDTIEEYLHNLSSEEAGTSLDIVWGDCVEALMEAERAERPVAAIRERLKFTALWAPYEDGSSGVPSSLMKRGMTLYHAWLALKFGHADTPRLHVVKQEPVQLEGSTTVAAPTSKGPVPWTQHEVDVACQALNSFLKGLEAQLAAGMKIPQLKVAWDVCARAMKADAACNDRSAPSIRLHLFGPAASSTWSGGHVRDLTRRISDVKRSSRSVDEDEEDASSSEGAALSSASNGKNVSKWTNDDYTQVVQAMNDAYHVIELAPHRDVVAIVDARLAAVKSPHKWQDAALRAKRLSHYARRELAAAQIEFMDTFRSLSASKMPASSSLKRRRPPATAAAAPGTKHPRVDAPTSASPPVSRRTRSAIKLDSNDSLDDSDDAGESPARPLTRSQAAAAAVTKPAPEAASSARAAPRAPRTDAQPAVVACSTSFMASIMSVMNSAAASPSLPVSAAARTKPTASTGSHATPSPSAQAPTAPVSSSAPAASLVRSSSLSAGAASSVAPAPAAPRSDARTRLLLAARERVNALREAVEMLVVDSEDGSVLTLPIDLAGDTVVRFRALIAGDAGAAERRCLDAARSVRDRVDALYADVTAIAATSTLIGQVRAVKLEVDALARALAGLERSAAQHG